uniref:Uncharacterized protein n=1 Tax=Meloidogyne hapla TaxID=6305 RepID=A0A1I8BXQ3_MELHA
MEHSDQNDSSRISDEIQEEGSSSQQGQGDQFTFGNKNLVVQDEDFNSENRGEGSKKKHKKGAGSSHITSEIQSEHQDNIGRGRSPVKDRKPLKKAPIKYSPIVNFDSCKPGKSGNSCKLM